MLSVAEEAGPGMPSFQVEAPARSYRFRGAATAFAGQPALSRESHAVTASHRCTR